jgi:hypothetical protein
MKTTEIKPFVECTPFRPFAVRLSNGARYEFRDPKSLGATRDGETLFFFGETGGFVLIDAENIVEIMSEKV